MSTLSQQGTLSQQQRADWERDGFLLLREFVSADELTFIRDRIERLANEEPANPAITLDLDKELADGNERPRSRQLRALIRGAHADPDLRDSYTLRQKTINVVAGLIGPDVIFYTDQPFFKPPGGSAIPPHQDNAYWNRYWVGDDKLSVWLAPGDSTNENGCTTFLPGTHKQTLEHDLVDDRVFGKKLEITDRQRTSEVPVELRAEDCCIHHAWVIHYSGPNVSDRARRGHVSIYFNAHTRQTAEPTPFPHGFISASGSVYPGCVGSEDTLGR
jgi:ectoine hydroxylase-related dioxygenase (phytanoyl-CoA dioxygenase family)